MITIKKLYEYAKKYDFLDATFVYPFVDENGEYWDEEVKSIVFYNHKNGKVTINLSGYNQDEPDAEISYINKECKMQ